MKPPRAATGQEIYLFPEITVPPPDADVSGAGQYGLEADWPVRNADNQSEAGLSIVGRIPTADSDKLPTDIVIRDLGVAVSIRQLIEEALARGGSPGDIARLIGEVGASQRGGDPVPRFALNRSSTDYGLETPFALRVNDSALAMSSGYDVPGEDAGYSTAKAKSVAVCLDHLERLLVFELIQYVTADGDQYKHRIRAFRYDQATAGATGDIVEITDETVMPFIEDYSEYTAGVDTGTTLLEPAIAAVYYQGDVYVIVTNAGNTSSPKGRLYVFRWDPTGDNATTNPSFDFHAGPIDISDGVVPLDGGIAAVALTDRVVVAVGTIIYTSAFEWVRTIQIGSSKDLRSWADSDTPDRNGFASMDQMEQVAASSDDADLGKFHFSAISFASDNLHGWACTTTGRVFATEDGGASWSEQQQVVHNVVLHDIQVAGIQDDEYVVYACGDQGVILRTLDSGVTWKIVRSSKEVRDAAETNLDDYLTGAASINFSFTLRAIKFATVDIGWVVGWQALFGTNNGTDTSGATTWTLLYPHTPWNVRRHYDLVDLAIEPASTPHAGYTIIVAGRIAHAIGLSEQLGPFYRFMRIGNAENTDTFPVQAPTILSEIEDGRNVRKLISRPFAGLGNNSHVHVVGDRGLWLTITDGVVAERTAPTDRTLFSIDIRFDENDEDNNEIFLGEYSGRLYRSVNNGGAFTSRIIMDASGRRYPLWEIRAPNPSVMVIAAYGLLYTNRWAYNRAFPALLKLNDGSVLLAAANVEEGLIEIFRSPNRGESLVPIDMGSTYAISFTKQSSMAALSDTTPRPSLTLDIYGTIILTAGASGAASLSADGSVWFNPSDARLPVPVGGVDPAAQAEDPAMRESRITIAYGGGRLFSFILNNVSSRYRTFTSREWVTGSSVYVPVAIDTPQWIGAGDVRIIWGASRATVGDSWTVNKRYRYPASHVHVESPSIFYRGPNDGALIASIVFEWDRQDSSIVALLGNGATWNVSAFALFGTNVPDCLIRVPKDTYGGAAFPTDPDDYIEFTLSAVVDRGIATGAVGTDTPFDILNCEGKEWTPSEFAPGPRQYYLKAYGAVWKIVDNTRNSLKLERAAGDTAIADLTEFEIFGDRMFCDGSGGQLGTQPAVPPLIDGPNQFVRWVDLIIPGYKTAEGYRKIGTVIFGRHVPITAHRPEGQLMRDQMGEAFRWRAIPNTLEEQALSGVTAIEHFSRAGQQWEFSYAVQEYWDRDATLAPFLKRMRAAFALVFDSDDPHTVELVRLSSQTPDVLHAGGDLYGYTLRLNEVV